MAGLVAVGCDHRANAFALSVAQAAPDFARLALGFDYSSGVTPEEASAWLCHAESEVRSPKSEVAFPLPRPRLAAIGEIGLDYSHPGADPSAQRALFERQVALAAERGLPVIVHSREAAADTLAILRAVGSRALAAAGRLGVLHCFVGDRAFAEEVLSLGMMVSFSGIVTFRNAEALRAVAATIQPDRLLVETDCPYLAPVPLRGRVNEPAFVVHIIRCLAPLRGTSPEALSAQTTSNALRLFAC